MASIKDLKFDHQNARKRTERSTGLIAESLKQFGAARSIVIDENGRVLAGNGTVEGAKAAGITKVRIIETKGDELIAVQRTGLTEKEKVGLALADNRSSDLSEWDNEMLRHLSEEHDIAPWFTSEDLSKLGIESPDFDPALEDDQGQLDKLDKKEIDCVCPSCGHEFIKQI